VAAEAPRRLKGRMMRMKARRRLLPKPPEPPPGMMWWYWDLVPIEDVEARAHAVMDGFDKQPRGQRDRLNYTSARTKKR
jgi:hypothetical protein